MTNVTTQRMTMHLGHTANVRGWQKPIAASGYGLLDEWGKYVKTLAEGVADFYLNSS